MEKRQSTDACFTISHPHLYYQKTQPRSHGGMSRRDFSKILHSVTTQLQFLLIAVAGWMSQHQQAVIEYLQRIAFSWNNSVANPSASPTPSESGWRAKPSASVGAALGNWPHWSLQIPCSVGFVS